MIATHPGDDLGAATWIDLLQPSDEEAARVHQATGLRVPRESEISEIESSSRLAFSDGSYVLSTPLVVHGDGEPLRLASVGFVLSSRVLITVRFASLPAFDAIHSTSRGADIPASEVFLRIVELVVDRAADALERAGAECDDLSDRAFRANIRDALSTNLRAGLRQIGDVASRTSHIRDALLGLGRIAAFLVESGFDGAPVVSAARLKAVRADIASLGDYEAHLAGKVQFLLDATLGFINIEQNEIVKTLTIASVVGIPPVLIAGIYGMNFHGMPELSWRYGYAYSLVLIVVSALVPIAWFKRRGWM